jgi:hypothetical protein
MPGVSLKNKPANGRPSVSTGAYQIDGIEAMGILSAYAEDKGLCPWMNANSTANSFLYPQVNAPADSATGG